MVSALEEVKIRLEIQVLWEEFRDADPDRRQQIVQELNLLFSVLLKIQPSGE